MLVWGSAKSLQKTATGSRVCRGHVGRGHDRTGHHIRFQEASLQQKWGSHLDSYPLPCLFMQLPIPYTPPPPSSASLKKRSWLCPVSPDSSPRRKSVCPSAVLTLQTPYPQQSISVLLNPFWTPFSMPLASGSCRGWQGHWHRGLLKICLHWKPKGLKREAVSAETSELFTYLLTTG